MLVDLVDRSKALDGGSGRLKEGRASLGWLAWNLWVSTRHGLLLQFCNCLLNSQTKEGGSMVELAVLIQKYYWQDRVVQHRRQDSGGRDR